MKSLIRLAKRNNSNASKEKEITDSGLNLSEAKYLSKTKQHLLDDKLSEKENLSCARSEKSIKSSTKNPSDTKPGIDFINK